MCDYTPSEIVEMISIPGECQKDYRANAWLRRERFPDRRLGEEICIDNVVDNSHDRSNTRSNFFKFSYQHTTLISVGKYCKNQSWHVTCYTSDETTFKNSGLLNRYNSNYWVDETFTLAEIGWLSTPMIVKCMVRHSKRSLSEFKLFNGTLTETRYNTFLTNKLQNPLENVLYATRIWF